ncbi:hypothetical protein AB0G15_34865 [Streptosporangium sp. NPDC023825]|uniref:hypothetical protein n=1 Tax=Streptosporangium sp. NPDC023825 TaxID=3154909 RepID=UPI003429BC23
MTSATRAYGYAAPSPLVEDGPRVGDGRPGPPAAGDETLDGEVSGGETPGAGHGGPPREERAARVTSRTAVEVTP